MADDVAITAGSGTSIATDDCTTGHVQLVKLAYGANGDRTQATCDANGLLVDLGSNNDVTVTSGSVTANAGTNLNTSLLAVESGGNLAASATSLALIDDGVATVASAITTKGMAAVGTDGTNARILKTDTSGELQVDVLSMPTTTVTATNLSTNLAQVAGATTATGNGTAAGSLRVSVASDSTGTIIATSATAANLLGRMELQTRTSGGMSTYHLVSAASTNATNIKNSAGQVYGWYIYNNNAAARKVAFHNTSGTPTAGASVFFSLVIPANSGANVMMPFGIAFSSGIAITTVTEVTDAGSTAVALNDLIINIFYA